MGKFLTGAIGLPQPTPLARFTAGAPVIIGPVLVGAAPGGVLGQAPTRAMAGAGGATLFHPNYIGWPAIAALVHDAEMRGGYDVTLHKVSITRDKTIAQMQPPACDNVVAVNLLDPMKISSALLNANLVKPNVRIICVSSIAGIAGNLGQTNYAASKAGIIGLVQTLAPRMQCIGGTINAFGPGFIETQMMAAIPFTIREAGRRMNSMAQGGQPDDVAEAIS